VAAFLDNPDLREAAGRKARAYAERTFSLDKVTEKFLNIMSTSNIVFAPNTHLAKSAVNVH
jgi:hypothetical protein